jgi:hypothetical protein
VAELVGMEVQPNFIVSLLCELEFNLTFHFFRVITIGSLQETVATVVMAETVVMVVCVICFINPCFF